MKNRNRIEKNIMKQIPNNKNWHDLNKFKETLTLTQEQIDIIVGTCLGDLYIRHIGKFSRLVFEQKNQDYLEHLYTTFKGFTRTPPKERQQKRLRNSEIKSTWYFSTISHSLIHDYRLLFYPEGTKIIPNNLESLLTPRALAYWVMDDGAKSGNSLIIYTGGFTFEEHEKLQTILKNKFNINTNIHGKNRKTKQLSLYIQQKSYKKFLNLIKPYMLSSMYYKLSGEEYSNNKKNDYLTYSSTFLANMEQQNSKIQAEPWISEYNKIFFPYKDKQNERISLIALEKILTPQVLGLWYMKKGSKSNDSFKITTNDFTQQENEDLIKIFIQLFNIKVTLQGLKSRDKRKICLYVAKESCQSFLNLIQPHIASTRKYKI